MNTTCPRCLSNSFPMLSEAHPKAGCTFCEGQDVEHHTFQRTLYGKTEKSLLVSQVKLTPKVEPRDIP